MARSSKYKPYTVSPEEVAAFLPAQGNIPGYGYQPQQITVSGTRRQMGSGRWRDAEKIRLLNLERARVVNAQNAALYNAAAGKLGEQEAANQGYGEFQRAQLDQQRERDIARQRQSFRRRGLFNSQRGINFDYGLRKMALEGSLVDRANQLRQQLVNFYGNTSSPPPSFGDMATYGQQPRTLLAEIANEQAQLKSGGKSRKGAAVAGGLKGAISGAMTGLALGGPPGAVAGAVLGGGIGAYSGYQGADVGGGGNYQPFTPSQPAFDTTGRATYSAPGYASVPSYDYNYQSPFSYGGGLDYQTR